jgi:hypothetical protein
MSRWRDTLPRKRIESPEHMGLLIENIREMMEWLRWTTYEDNLLAIKMGYNGHEMDIDFKYPDGTCINPVIMVVDDDRVIRCHGEHVYVIPQLEDMIAFYKELSKCIEKKD